MRLWPGRTPEHNRWSDWIPTGEAAHPDDGATVRRFERFRFDMEEQLEHSEDRYEVLVDGAVVQQEHHVNSPATRWYTQEQSLDVYREAGFEDLRAVSGFTDAPAAPDDRIWSVFGRRPE